MNKNLLSENMLRFGTKNLSERQERELIVKSIMETINNNGLHGEVYRRLMMEQSIVFPKRNPSYEKTYVNDVNAPYGVSPEIAKTSGIKKIAKAGATYTTNNYFGGGAGSGGEKDNVTNYMFIPKGTVFKADPNTNCAYAIVKLGTKWKMGRSLEDKYPSMMADNTQNGSLISQIEFGTSQQVSFNFSEQALITPDDTRYKISETLYAALQSLCTTKKAG